MSQKVAVKLSSKLNGSDKRSKFFLVSSLKELLIKGAEAFQQTGRECEIVSSCNTPIESDEILFHFASQKDAFFLQAIGDPLNSDGDAVDLLGNNEAAGVQKNADGDAANRINNNKTAAQSSADEGANPLIKENNAGIQHSADGDAVDPLNNNKSAGVLSGAGRDAPDRYNNNKTVPVQSSVDGAVANQHASNRRGAVQSASVGPAASPLSNNKRAAVHSNADGTAPNTNESESDAECDSLLTSQAGANTSRQSLENSGSGQLTSRSSEKEGDFFPIFEILRLGRQGKTTPDTAAVIQSRLLEAEVASDRDKTFVIHAAGIWFMNNTSNVERFPTPREYLKMAKSIVHFFPSARNRSNKKRPWSLIYDEQTRQGPLEFYVRGKRHRLKKIDCPEVVPEIPPKKKKRFADEDGVVCEDEEANEAERFMRTYPLDPKTKPNSNRDEMLKKFRMTRQIRRGILLSKKKRDATVLLNRFPRLKDMIEAVDDEFYYLKKSSATTFVNNWKNVEKGILLRAKTELLQLVDVRAIIKKAEEAEERFDTSEFTFCVFQLLLHLLPNRKPAERRSRLPTADAWSLFLHKFTEVILPSDAATAATSMERPGLLLINNQYFVKIDNMGIPLPNCTSLEMAVAYLVIYYYNLNLNYPEPLKFVFVFLEMLFQIDASASSEDAKKLFGNVFLHGN